MISDVLSLSSDVNKGKKRKKLLSLCNHCWRLFLAGVHPYLLASLLVLIAGRSVVIMLHYSQVKHQPMHFQIL